MAIHLKIAFVTFLLMLIVTEEFKPVLAKNKKDTLKKRTATLENDMQDVQGRVKQLESCKACEKIKQLNDMINVLKQKVGP